MKKERGGKDQTESSTRLPQENRGEGTWVGVVRGEAENGPDNVLDDRREGWESEGRTGREEVCRRSLNNFSVLFIFAYHSERKSFARGPSTSISDLGTPRRGPGGKTGYREGGERDSGREGETTEKSDFIEKGEEVELT